MVGLHMSCQFRCLQVEYLYAVLCLDGAQKKKKSFMLLCWTENLKFLNYSFFDFDAVQKVLFHYIVIRGTFFYYYYDGRMRFNAYLPII